jgi:hypothetical protein
MARVCLPSFRRLPLMPSVGRKPRGNLGELFKRRFQIIGNFGCNDLRCQQCVGVG